MARNIMEEIRQSARDFDINSLESDEIAAERIDDMSGDGDTAEEDRNVPDAIPFKDAVAIVDGVEDQAFQLFHQAAQTMMDGYLAESKNLKVSQDHRTLHGNMALGIENLLVTWSEYVAEANERVKQATPEEKRARGAKVKRVINVGPSSLHTEPPSSAPSATVRTNTKAAQEFFKKNDATGN